MFGKKQKGFTLVELITSIIVLGVAAIVLVAAVGIVAAFISIIFNGFFGG